MSDNLPNDDELSLRLRLSGWLVAEASLLDPESGEPRHVVLATQDLHTIRAEGATPAEAWREACRKAESLGLFRRGSLDTRPDGPSD